MSKSKEQLSEMYEVGSTIHTLLKESMKGNIRLGFSNIFSDKTCCRLDSLNIHYIGGNKPTVLKSNYFEEHLRKVLNDKFDEIMIDVAESILKEVKDEKASIIENLRQKIDELEKL